MADVAMTSWYDELLPDMPGLDTPIGLNRIRAAVIDFCQRARCWVIDGAAITSVANTAVYALPASTVASTEDVGVIRVTYNNGTQVTELAPISRARAAAKYGDAWMTYAGDPLYFLQDDPSSVRLLPVPSTGLANALVISIAIKPIRTATVVPDWFFSNYFETIAKGAKARLFAVPKKPWTDLALSQHYQSQFESDILQASSDRSAGDFGKYRLRVIANP